MRHVRGIITVVQEGRFRLGTEDGRSMLFTLDRRSSIDAQDLQDLLSRPGAEVAYTVTDNCHACTAHDIRFEGRRRGDSRRRPGRSR